MECPTVRVKCEATDDNPAGFIVINKSDYNPEIHTTVEAYEAGVTAARAKAAQKDVEEADRKDADAAKVQEDGQPEGKKAKKDK